MIAALPACLGRSVANVGSIGIFGRAVRSLLYLADVSSLRSAHAADEYVAAASVRFGRSVSDARMLRVPAALFVCRLESALALARLIRAITLLVFERFFGHDANTRRQDKLSLRVSAAFRPAARRFRVTAALAPASFILSL